MAISQPKGQTRVVRRIAFLRATGPQEADYAAFLSGLARLGWREGDNIAIDVRYAHGDPSRLPDRASAAVSRVPEVIVVDGDLTARAGLQAAPATPVVFTLVTDPIRLGLTTSLSRPSGSSTGQTGFSLELTAKRIELLKDALPATKRLGVMLQAGPAIEAHRAQVERTADALALVPEFHAVSSAETLERVLGALRQLRPDAVVTLYSPLFYTERARIVAALMQARVPGVHPEHEFVKAGGLMAYGVHFPTLWAQSARYVDRILRGEKPGDLPIEQPTRIEFSINLQTARTLGLNIPPTLLARADEVIE